MKNRMTSTNFKILDGGLESELIKFDLPTEINQNVTNVLSDEMSDNNFDNFVSHYYYLKSIEQNMAPQNSISTLGGSSEELAEQLLKTPVSEPRQVLLKLNILDNELSNDMDCTMPVGRKHLMIFAALKADIITLMAELS